MSNSLFSHHKDDEFFVFPSDQVQVLLTRTKRKDKFFCLYEPILQNSPHDIFFFLLLLRLAGFDNRLANNRSDLAKLLGVSLASLKYRLTSLRQKGGVRGRNPLFLNPFWGSKCGGALLRTLREQWLEEK